jgi:hypothetical protein
MYWAPSGRRDIGRSNARANDNMRGKINRYLVAMGAKDA